MSALRPAEVRTLALLAATFVPAADPERIAGLAAEALLRAADPAQVLQLRLVLRALELAPVNGATSGKWHGLAALQPAEREAVLFTWATSRVPQRRAAFQALRRLVTFLAYADPGTAERVNHLPAAVGYEPDHPPVTGDVTPIRPLDLHRGEVGSRSQPLVLDADVVIVGSGAGGGVVAAELARAGRSVVVLEAGPFVDEASMPRNELEAFSRLYLNHGLLASWDGAVTLLAGSAVGGGTLVNWMTSIDVPEDVRDEWGRDHGLDGIGPGDDREWLADVAAIEAELGVAPATVIPPKDRVIGHGASALGWESGTIRRNARDCGTCGSCPFGCVVGAKQSGIRAHLRWASEAGARVIDRVRVTRVLRAGDRAIGVEGRLLVTDAVTGMPVLHDDDPTAAEVRTLIVHARQIVLGAGALRTPAILQGSSIGHPEIGRSLRVHPVSVVAARLAEPVDMWQGTMQAVRSLEFLRGDASRRGYTIESAPGHPGLLALALPWSSAADHARRMASARYLAPLIAITRDGGEGRISLTRAGRVRIDYRLDDPGRAALRHGLVSMARLARAAPGVEEIVGVATPMHAWATAEGDSAWRSFEAALASQDFGPNRGAVFSAHQLGSARMGADPATHPTDPRGRVRADRRGSLVRGLYVADGSTFPTGTGVNPMIGIMAIARRISRTILAGST